MVQNRPVALDGVLPLPAVGLKGFVEGLALHTSRRAVGLKDFVEGLALHTSRWAAVGLNHALTFLVGG